MKQAVRMMAMTLTILGLLVVAETVFAQSSSSAGFAGNNASQNTDADTLFQKGDWAGAVSAYQAITIQEPSNGRAWYRLGYALHSLKRYEEAAKAYHQSVAIGGNPVAMYNLACAYARLNEKDKAFAWLNQSVKKGFNQPRQISTDEDLVTLRSDSRFSDIVAQAQKNANPCNQPEFRQFDFWIGEWDVTANGNPAGTNTIELVSGSCALLENWVGRGGVDGKSLNYFNPADGKWHQLWVGAGGSILDLVGEYKDDTMRFTGETRRPNGGRTLQRLTFFRLSPDRVRQFWEQSADEGKTWTVAFDGNYVRKKKVE